MTRVKEAGGMGAALQLMKHSGAAFLSLIAVAAPLSVMAQDAPVAEAAPPAGDGVKAESTFTPLKEVLRVRDEGCGKEQFADFFYWYTIHTDQGGWLEQVVFTNYLVKIANLENPDQIYDWEDRMDYVGQFRITSRDLHSTNARPEEGENPHYRRVTATQVNDTTYRVDWAGGPGFGGVPKAQQFNTAGAYIFEYLHDCWYLTEDLR